MLPHEKALVKRLKEQPFALIGINSDGPADKVREILSKDEISWRQVVDVSTSGPLATKWNVQSWPTIYVIDSKGVIRFKGEGAKEMEDTVTKLLGEIEGKK